MSGDRGRSAVRLAALVTLALCACLAYGSSASASGFKVKGAFCEPTGVGTPPCSPEFGKPVALAVAPASGDLLVVNGEANTISRFKPDGTPDNFSALGSNVVDGKAGPGGKPCGEEPASCDKTPQNGLDFGSGSSSGNGSSKAMQIAVAPAGSAGGTAGDIYVTQRGAHLIDIFSSSGEYLGQLTEFKEGLNATGPFKAFNLTVGVAVDPAGAVYVSAFDGTAAGEVHKYVPAANPVTNANDTANFARPSFGHVAAGAGPTNGYIFSAEFNGKPAKVDSASGVQQYVVTNEESLALDVNREDGHLFSASNMEVKEYDASGASEAELVSSFAPGAGIKGMAVDAFRELVYLSKEGSHTIEVWEVVKVPEAITLPASPVGQQSATLNGEVNPNGSPLTECSFEWGETTAYGNTAPCAEYKEGGVWHPLLSPSELAGSAFVPVRAEVAVEAGTEYHFRLAVGNENTTPATNIKGTDKAFTALGPQLRGEGAAEVGATTAQVNASIGPNGEETGFWVQYLTEAAYQANPPGDRFAGAARSPAGEREVPATVAGTGNVKAGSRLISSAIATAGRFGVGQAIEGPGIPAGTKIAFMESPSELRLSQPATETTSGAALSATGPQPVSQLLSGLSPDTAYRFRVVAKNGGGETQGEAKQLSTAALPGVESCPNASTRQGYSAALPDCRAYEMVSPPRKTGEVIAPEPSSELGGSCVGCLPGTLEQTRPMQSAPGGEAVLYSGQPFGAGLSGGQNAYLSGREGSGWNIAALNPLATIGTWEAFSADLSRGVLAQSEPPLAPTAPTRGGEAFANLYLVAGGALTPLIVEEPPHRSPGPSSNRLQVRYAAANPGSATTGAFTHVLFEANDALTGATASAPAAPEVGAANECTFSPCDLYEWTGGQLALVNVEPGNGAPLGGAVIGAGRLLEQEVPGYEAPTVNNAISADGSRVFFTSEETGQLYVRVNGEETLEVPGPGSCKASVAEGSRACFLTASADGAEVLLSDGELFALNGAETAYEPIEDLSEGEGGFEGILGTGEEGGQIARAYFADAKVLPGAAANAEGEEAAEETGKVNLYYWQEGALRFVAALAAGDNQFFGQHAYGSWKAPQSNRTAQASPDGRYLTFMSAAPLTGYDNACRRQNPNSHEYEVIDCREVFEYAAATGALHCASCNPSGQPPLGPSNLTRLHVGVSGPDFRQPNNLPPAGNGLLFFESQDALLPQDTNGKIQDVYEWKPQGVGGCARPGGCLALISSGSSPDDSMFMDASESGNDAFLITRQQLVAADEDGQLDLYDARALGGFAPGQAPAPCEGEACRGPASEAPASPSAASQSFAGPGNPKPAKSKHHARHKHKKHKHKKPKRHGKPSRGGRR